MAVTDRMMKACTLSKWSGRKTTCRWCDTTLTGKQRRWCSTTCGDEAFTEHNFSWGRKRALDRDGKKCSRCGAKDRILNGMWVSVRLEVNHKKPAMGTHSKAGCQHHVSDLETLCRKCHLLETKRQREAGEFKR